MPKGSKPDPAHFLTSLATAIEARRGLAEDSVHMLMEGLRAGDSNAIHFGLRALGVHENNAIYEKIGMMTHSLHSLLGEFREDLAPTATIKSGATIVNAAERLEEVMLLSFEAADKTTHSTRRVAELLKQQDYALQIAREVLNDPSITDAERHATLNEFIDKQECCVTAIRVVNHEVLMTQNFQELTSKVLRKVIGVIRTIENKLFTLDSIYAGGDFEPDEADKTQ